MMGRRIVAFPALLGVPMLLSVCLLGCVTPQGVVLSSLARELSTPERGEQRFDFRGGRTSSMRRIDMTASFVTTDCRTS